MEHKFPVHCDLIKSIHLKALFFGLISLIFVSGCSSLATTSMPEAPPASNWVQACTDWDDWDKAGPPFQLYGNSYYVGTCGISSILITGEQGHILIDGGTEKGAEVIASNIESLGFSLSDIKLLLHSHEHFDHVAGLSKLQQISGAQLLASAKAAPVLNTGVVSDADPQAGMHEAFPAAKVNGIVEEGIPVTLGSLSLRPVSTPGHTPGALSWQWHSCEKDRCLSIVYADSLSPISSEFYRFNNAPNYVDAYREGLTKLAILDCDILVAPHPSASKMRQQLSIEDGIIDPENCLSYAKNISTRLDKRLNNEQTQ